MPLLQVRDFPREIYELIKIKAEQEHRSIAQQTIVLIKNGLEKDSSGTGINTREHRQKILEGIKNIDIPKEAKNFDVVKSIREDRKR